MKKEEEKMETVETEPDVPEIPDIPGWTHNFNAFRRDMIAQDWTDDKIFGANSKGGTQYPYLSADKTFRTVSPLLAKHNLELELEYSELTKQPECNGQPERWTVRLKAVMTDLTTGDKMTDTIYGEAGDRADKGVAKAQTVALKNYFTRKYSVADGIYSDIDDDRTYGRAFRPLSEEETIEVKSKIAAQALPKPPVQKPAMPAPQRPVIPPKAPAQAPKAPVPQVPAPQRAPAPVEKTGEPIVLEDFSGGPTESEREESPMSGPAFEIKGVHKDVVDRILQDYESRSEDDRDLLYRAYHAIDSNEAVVDFIRVFGVR